MKHQIITLRHRLLHPLTFLWVILCAGGLALWTDLPERTELPVWEQVVFYVCLALALLFGEISVPALDRKLARIPAILLPVCACAAFLQTEVSIANPMTSLSNWGVAWNLLIAASICLVCYFLLGRMWLAGIVSGVLMTLLSVVNFFTLLFRGTPVCPADIFSAGTAAEVAGGYEITFTPAVAVILAVFLAQLAISLVFYRTEQRPASRKAAWAIRFAALAAAFVWFWIGSLPEVTAGVGLRLVDWSWSESYYPNGYLCTTLLRVNSLFYQKPPGYSDAKVTQFLDEMSAEPGERASSGELPNIILIVNESWFDWSQVTDFTTSAPVTPFLDGLDNCVRGYAVNPVVGTAASEYEILTSNSMGLFPSNNPFTQMNLKNSSSIARYLGELGYTSSAFHPCPATNYNRNTAYPALGFDNVYFGDSPELDAVDVMNIHIGFSDLSCFEVLCHLYEEQQSDQPQFLYNLTFQNHGGYQIADFNGGWWKTDPERRIYVTSGFENVRSEAEEYFTSLTYTDEAFQYLVEYFEAVDDPTVICMVGDHQSYFSESTPDGHTGYESTMYQRGTPFVIWANFPIEEEEVGYIGMPQLVPLLLQTAGVELSPYYQSITELYEEVPVLASVFYRTSDGEFHSYDLSDAAEIPGTLQRYLYFEYNNVATHTRKDSRLLTPFS